MKRYFGLLLPVLITLAGLAVIFSLPARGLHPAQAAESTFATQQWKTQDFALQAFRAEVYLPILLIDKQPGSFMEAVITTQGYELSFPNQYFVYGYMRNLTTEPLYDVFIHFEVTWYCSSDDLGNTGISYVTPVLTATLPGQLNPFAISIFEIKNCYPSIGPIVGISANPWMSGEEYYPLTITGYEHVDSIINGTVRNDSGKPLQHARVAGLLPEPQLGEIEGDRYCGPVEAALDTDTLLPGQETSFTIGYFNCDVDDSLIVVGQGAYQP